MNKVFNGSDVILQAQIYKSSGLGLIEPAQAKEWDVRTIFLVGEQINWYTSQAVWKSIHITQIAELRIIDLKEYAADYPNGLVIVTQSQIVKNYIYGFKTSDERASWITTLRCLSSSNQTLRSFVNKGITTVHIAILYKQFFQSDHPLWPQIAQSPEVFAKEMRLADSSGLTPLHLAAYFNQLIELQLFLTNGCFINSQTDSGLTALHMAIMGESFMAFDYLIENGAQMDIPDASGESVQQIIQSRLKGTLFEARIRPKSSLFCDLHFDKFEK